MIGIRDYAPEDAPGLLPLYAAVGWTNYTDRPDMLTRALQARYPDVHQTQLLTDDTPQTVAFYRRLGFVRAEEMGCCAMTLFR